VEGARRYRKLVQTEDEAVRIVNPNKSADGPPEPLPLVTTQKEALMLEPALEMKGSVASGNNVWKKMSRG
jgi:hypothetical protein